MTQDQLFNTTKKDRHTLILINVEVPPKLSAMPLLWESETAIKIENNNNNSSLLKI